MSIVLVVHQSADLYGSDLSLLATLKCLPKHLMPVVVLPERGPLDYELGRRGIEVHVGPVGKITNGAFSWRGILRLLFQLYSSHSFLKRVVAGRHLSFVYSNTVAVLGGAAYAWRSRVSHVWHIREIIERPRLARAVLSRLICCASIRVLCNSNATLEWVCQARRFSIDKAVTIWNGVDAPPVSADFDRLAVRATLGCGPGEILVALVGRVTRRKGQEVLLGAMEQLLERGVANVKAVLVGSPTAQYALLADRLRRRCYDGSLRHFVSFKEFTRDVWSVWRACDIAIVPSTEPESFGRVAIEAMAVGRPVIASNHGGLAEIVEHGKTGLLVPPRDSTELSRAIEQMATDADLRNRFGMAGAQRYSKLFTAAAYEARVKKEFEELPLH